MEFVDGKWRRTTEEKEQIRQKLLGRPSPNKGGKSPKKGLTEVAYYGEEKAVLLAARRSEVHRGKVPWNKGLPCSEETKAKIGKANTSSEQRDSVKYREWTKRVSQRDENRCQHCGARQHHFGSSQALYSHHVKPWEDFPSLRFVTENGLTLCSSCHSRLENTFRVLRRNNFAGLTAVLGDDFKICTACHRLVETQLDVTPCFCKQDSAHQADNCGTASFDRR